MTAAAAQTADPETILIVDGEILVRLELAAYLRECGYRVIEAVAAHEAMVVLQQTQVRVDLVFCDLGAQEEADGFGLASWVRTNRPQVKAVLAATTERAATLAGDICENGPLQRKPYDHRQVHDRIRQLLATRS